MAARWVYTWKRVGGVGGEITVNARLCVKGFQDAMSSILMTIAATAALLTHRIFAATAANLRMPLTSMDISAAFLKGLSFDETAETDGQRRRAYFNLPNEEDYAILLELDPAAGGGETLEGGVPRDGIAVFSMLSHMMATDMSSKLCRFLICRFLISFY